MNRDARAQPRGAQRRLPLRGVRVGERDPRARQETQRLVKRRTALQKADVRANVPDQKSVRLVRNRVRNVIARAEGDRRTHTMPERIHWKMKNLPEALNGKIEGPADAGIALGVIGACLVVPPTLFSVAAAIKDVAA